MTTLSFDIAGLELYLPLIAGGRIELASQQVGADGWLLQKQIEASGRLDAGHTGDMADAD